MSASTRSDTALLWDNSYVWGLMLYEALCEAGFAFDLVRAGDVRAGCLREYRVLMVPGGWASNKMQSLGAGGAEAIREFVRTGGVYVGICGGAGMATSDALGLIDVARKPLKERVPSLSGRVRVTITDSPLLQGLCVNQDTDQPEFSIYWPSQFVPRDESLQILARFDRALATSSDSAFSADLPVADMTSQDWSQAEAAYGINLNPERMHGEPLLIEGTYGAGTVIASLLHIDAPGCANGRQVLENLRRRFALRSIAPMRRELLSPVGELYGVARELHEFGLRNFLWFERPPLVQWRRGIRGLEYHNLYCIAREIGRLHPRGLSEEDEEGAFLVEELRDFSARAQRLLSLERQVLNLNINSGAGDALTFSRTPSPEIAALREELFAKSKSYGGWYRELLDAMDCVLYGLLLQRQQERTRDEQGARGLVQIYTGDGKGKTTACVGLALRARSRGLRVLFCQFMKGRQGGEPEALRMAGAEVRRFYKVLSPLFHAEADLQEIRREASAALAGVTALLNSREFDVVVMDEFITLTARGLLDEAAALEFIRSKPAHVELVLSGRGATGALRDAADLVTYMQALKHPYATGIGARRGIEY